MLLLLFSDLMPFQFIEPTNFLSIMATTDRVIGIDFEHKSYSVSHGTR